MSLQSWEVLPEPILIRILGYLSLKDIASSSQTCRRWWEVSEDNSLWRNLLRRKYKLKSVRIRDPTVSWKHEYHRLNHLSPSRCSQTLTNHRDEVLYVAFSNSGENFVTCSKDGSFIVWRMNESFVAELEHQEDMRKYGWKCTWSSKYNVSDSLLLVVGAVDDINGEIAIFAKHDANVPYRIKCRVANNPYDVMGDWVSEFHFFSGRFLTEGGRNWPSATLYMCEVDPRAEPNISAPSATTVVKNVILKYMFSDGSWNYLRCLHVTDRTQFKQNLFTDNSRSREEQVAQQADESCIRVLQQKQTCLIFLTNSESLAPHQVGFCMIGPDDLTTVSYIRSPDKVIDLHGHIVGLSLSPDNKFLYVNVRRWPSNANLSLLENPAIACEIEMRVVELESLQLLDTVFTGHKGFTDSFGAFYIYIDVSKDLIASGSEDKIGRIWDRSYGCQVSDLVHDECVNSVSFSPVTQQLAVSASDDYSVKVWKSKALMKSTAKL